MRLLGWIAIFVLTACAKPENPANHVGETLASLEKAEGAPIAVEPPPAAAKPPASATTGSRAGPRFDFKTTTIHRYPGGRSYQIQNEKVVAFHRAPEPDERAIQAWYHKPGAARRETTVARVDESRSGHVVLGAVRFVDLKRTVVYDRASGEVIRVIEQ